MPIELIDKIKQKNNGEFPLVEAQDVEVSEGKRLPEALNEKLSINELNNAINVALTQAKESGEFKGEQGIQGERGLDGAKGEKGDTAMVNLSIVGNKLVITNVELSQNNADDRRY